MVSFTLGVRFSSGRVWNSRPELTVPTVHRCTKRAIRWTVAAAGERELLALYGFLPVFSVWKSITPAVITIDYTSPLPARAQVLSVHGKKWKKNTAVISKRSEFNAFWTYVGTVNGILRLSCDYLINANVCVIKINACTWSPCTRVLKLSSKYKNNTIILFF